MIPPDLSPPAPITDKLELSNFDSGESSLNEWLKRRAFKNHATGASRCFVLCAGADVIGYYSLSAGAISHEVASKVCGAICLTHCLSCCSVGLP